jgi:hypothetical protein
MLILPSVQGANSRAPMINHQGQSHISAWRATSARRRDQTYEAPRRTNRFAVHSCEPVEILTKKQ